MAHCRSRLQKYVLYLTARTLIMDYRKIIKEICKIGKLMVNPADYRISSKGDFNYVTDLDVLIERKITSFLQRKYPDIPMWSEETNHKPDGGRYWLLDPIDGTTNFMHDLSLSVISLALMENNRPVFALVYHPYLKNVYTAHTGKGAFLNGQQIKVSERPMKDSLIGFGTAPYNRAGFPDLLKKIDNIFPHVPDVRRIGAAALDLAFLARGSLDGFFESVLSPWDFAAGYLLVTEAGGILTTWEGKEVDFTAKTSLIGGNKKNFDDLVRIFNQTK